MKLLLIPVSILAVSLLLLAGMAERGFERSVELTGGTQITVYDYVPEEKIEKVLPGASVRYTTGLKKTTIIELPPGVEIPELDFGDYTVRTVGPALGEKFFEQAKTALVIAFLFMGLLIFLIFRSPLPSFYVILAAAADIVEAFVASQLLGIKFSLPVLAALLLLIGYSVDTDILLTTRVLRSSEPVEERFRGALKTGLTMTLTTIGVLAALLLVSGSQVLTEIAAVLLLGLLFDLINTWLLNAVLLKWYVKR